MFDFSEKDTCGVGFIESRNIPPTHGMILKALECLVDLAESQVSQKPEHVKALD